MGDSGAPGDVNSNVLVSRSTGDAQLDKAVWQWLSWDKNPRTREQIESLLRDGKHRELRQRLCCRLSFGTAGLRSAMGAGFCYINDLTVIQSTQGIYTYLERNFSDFKQRGFVVGYDTRGQVTSNCSSKKLAKLTAAVLLAKDVLVYFFSTYVPTPFVPYAVQQLGAVAGVMITASHNRKEDNGYKVYWENGAQITSPHDKEIIKCIEECVEPWNGSWNENLVDTSPLRQDPLKKICDSYMEDLTKICYHSGSWKVFTGNELAALFGWWMFSCWKEKCPQDADVSNVYMLATTVSSKILRAIALKEGFHFEETLPGFKWIGSRVKDLLDNGKEVLFAFEESIGFMCGTSVLDKDGVSAAVVIAEMATYLQSQGLTLAQKLVDIFEMYGYHISKTSYFLCYDPATIKKIFERLRSFEGPESYPKSCGAYGILHVRDITTGYDSSQLNHKSVLPVSKSSQMITFTFQNGCVATLRTSGTEPKIKYYAEMCALPGHSDRSVLEGELQKLIEALIEDFLEPAKNGLTWRSA
ncbi:glucose 1,6-bisphosphate synthase isoform X2 [Ammospiza caudacuta]|uniref:glucose 1,6-bisphosphate synthase isoform X2 n=1 Tax=Ammospiza caudacuta TaxID=2857398 RepID=UPI00273A06E8|nr:glucose 1,6-bisphosphate synthase isoform X2 [Ammospiza caudacuta]